MLRNDQPSRFSEAGAGHASLSQSHFPLWSVWCAPMCTDQCTCVVGWMWVGKRSASPNAKGCAHHIHIIPWHVHMFWLIRGATRVVHDAVKEGHGHSGAPAAKPYTLTHSECMWTSSRNWPSTPRTRRACNDPSGSPTRCFIILSPDAESPRCQLSRSGLRSTIGHF